ncbi:MAG: hypothetical protein WAK11_08535 [Candidatus Cybelea sp.]
MNHNISVITLVVAMAITPVVASADTQSNTVMQRGYQIMPFDMTAAMHMFLPDSTGGVLEVMFYNMDHRQITLVRSHLLAEAAKFARGDYSDPAYIHGQGMPGLGQLESSASSVSVRYFETPTGAAITFSSAEAGVVSAIHQWLAAQQQDHGSAAMQHCNMKM